MGVCVMKVTPLKNRYIVFSVPIRRKVRGSTLFKGNAKRYAYNRAEEVWIMSCGLECKETFEMGTHCWINDSFELEPTDLNLWEESLDKPEFKKLKEFVDNCDGDVKTSLLSEDSLLCVDNDYEAEEINHGVVLL